MSCGKPVVATRSGGIPEFVADGESGLLFRPDDVAGCTAALRTLHDPALRERMGCGRPRRGARALHGRRRALPAWSQVYRAVVASRAASHTVAAVGVPAMNVRVGTDLQQVADVRRRPGRVRRPLHVARLHRARTCGRRRRPARPSPQALAARFAAKEAVLKVLRAGDRPVDLRDIEIVRTADGAPRGRAARCRRRPGLVRRAPNVGREPEPRRHPRHRNRRRARRRRIPHPERPPAAEDVPEATEEP